MVWANRFSLSGLIVSYSTFHQMWEVITERDGIEVGYRGFPSKKKAEAFAMNKLATALEMITMAIKENGKAVSEMMNLLRAEVIQ